MNRWTAALLVATAVALGAHLPARAGTEGERRLGDTLSFALPAATLATELWRGDGAGAGQFTRSFALTLTATELLKRSTHVERPDGSNDESFPSGHAARAFAAATYVHARHGFDHAWPLYLLATYVGHTRVQAHRHRWVDIAGAAAVAAASSHWLVQRQQPAGASLAVQPRPFMVYVNLPLR
ncbi:MAG: phosphatase PAP2 family protein [Rhizobacter sp.]|nr:phosphatase PAP2 family protein [Rhizobacter sp.]